jgi:cytochrome c-type biogenesis protein CcmH
MIENLIWPVAAAMTALVVAVLAIPAFRSGAARERLDFDKAIFADQLAELERDVGRGLIGRSEADAAANEIKRRLLVASKADGREPWQAPRAAGLALLVLPLLSLPIYWKIGSPALQDVPLAARLAAAEQSDDIEAQLAKVELYLKDHPRDAKGWELLIPAYMQMGRYGDAAAAIAKKMEAAGSNPEDLANYAEALAFESKGMVPAEAVRALDVALKLDPKMPKARYYRALALKQEGKAGEAKAAFEALLADAPPDAPWRGAVVTELARPPSLSQEQIAAGQAMKPDDRTAMIRSMVDGLEQKLGATSEDLEGWSKLIRARSVLGEMDKAKAAYARALAIFKAKPEAVASLNALAQELNVQ